MVMCISPSPLILTASTSAATFRVPSVAVMFTCSETERKAGRVTALWVFKPDLNMKAGELEHLLSNGLWEGCVQPSLETVNSVT